MPRCRIVPQVGHRYRVLIDRREVTSWNFDPRDPRPCFHPIVAPGGTLLTRMGHPGAPDHDHHRSVWFAHHQVMGVNFWADGTGATIRQTGWLAFEEGDERAALAVDLVWTDGHDPQPLLAQRLIALVRPDGASAWQLEIATTFTAPRGTIELGQSNFGAFAVRVAADLSPVFGGGTLTGSDGAVGEANLFERNQRWLDCSGTADPVSRNELPATTIDVGSSGSAATVEQAGLTLFDHPSNPQYPSRWHVRDDGWFAPSTTGGAGIVIDAEHPLTIRHLLDLHDGPLDVERAERVAERFAGSAIPRVIDSTRPHRRHEIVVGE
jgi:hypothetical protein